MAKRRGGSFGFPSPEDLLTPAPAPKAQPGQVATNGQATPALARPSVPLRVTPQQTPTAFGRSVKSLSKIDSSNGVVMSPAQVLSANPGFNPGLARGASNLQSAKQHNAALSRGSAYVPREVGDGLGQMAAVKAGVAGTTPYGPNVGMNLGVYQQAKAAREAQEKAAYAPFAALQQGHGFESRISATNPTLASAMGLTQATNTGNVGTVAEKLHMTPEEVAHGIISSPGDPSAMDRYTALNSAALADARAGNAPMYIGPYRGQGGSAGDPAKQELSRKANQQQQDLARAMITARAQGRRITPDIAATESRAAKGQAMSITDLAQLMGGREGAAVLAEQAKGNSEVAAERLRQDTLRKIAVPTAIAGIMGNSPTPEAAASALPRIMPYLLQPTVGQSLQGPSAPPPDTTHAKVLSYLNADPALADQFYKAGNDPKAIATIMARAGVPQPVADEYLKAVSGSKYASTEDPNGPQWQWLYEALNPSVKRTPMQTQASGIRAHP